MGTDRNRRTNLRKSRTRSRPGRSWLCGLKSLAKFNSLEDYISWIAEDSSRAPLPKMLQQIESGIIKRPQWPGKDSSGRNSPWSCSRRADQAKWCSCI